ncbi:MAG TPA: bifunctional alpha/beta hydrolase/class I SAM-dependent methyltransferase [Bryobacteraceae bacterium]|nr:bifunctional alpha/beta hydrolase/class I SAM-dependent methyltransferase [Bryobacteraceae bacterium]
MRSVEERRFALRDGTELFYRHWPAAEKGSEKKAVILLHRGHEHSGRMTHVAEELNLPGFAIFAWDARAHGRSGGVQDSGVTMSTFSSDLDEFVRHIAAEFDIVIPDIAVVAQSVGAVFAAAWVHDYAPPIRCLVLASPAFKVKLYVPFARLGLTIWHALVGDFFVQSYVKGAALTHDKERAASYATDPLIKRPISARVLLGLYTTANRLIEDAQAIRVPTQLLLSGRDWVVHNKPQHDFFHRLGTSEKELHTFDGFFHDTLGEKDRHLPIAKARAFILKYFDRPPIRESLLEADRKGYTHDEYQALRRPLPALHPKAINFALTRLSMKAAGQHFSNGIRLGVETGFDSGATLDYVYRNEPKGLTPIGKLVDWGYLNAIGWRGIRVRRRNLEGLIQKAIGLVRQAGLPARIVDIAAGHGRYVLEAGAEADHILLRDFRVENVNDGRKLIAEKKVPARFEQGDAFDRKSLAALEPKPTIGIVSGLYELFPENQLLRESLAGLAEAIPSGGYLIYTGQPWHPQLEMIARTLTSHRDGQPWVMRRRTQGELDQLVEAAGFRKVDQRVDEWGIFTVSLAQRL